MKRPDEVIKSTGVDLLKIDTSATSNPGDQSSAECPLCGGLGYVRHDVSPGHPDFGKLFPCRCRLTEIEEQRREQLRILSNLDHLARMTFETFVTNRPGMSLEKASNLQSALDLARKYAGDPQGWLIFLGGYGCGKTHLAAAIANHALQRGRTVLFVVVPDLLDYLRATYAPTSPVSYDERFEQVRNAPLLILDDLGTQSSTAWAQEKLFQLLNYRYNARLPTVITSNQRLEEIDLRLRSRMVDPDLGIICPILAPDFRQGGVDKDHSELSSLPLMQDMTFEKFDLRQDELRDPTDRFTLKEAFSLCRNYAKEPVGWLVLAGPHGCGKTHLAAAIANTRVSMGTSALFVVVPDLLDHLRATFSPTSQIRFDRRFEEVKTAPLLVLDDLGTESASPWAQEKLYQLLNHRYNARLPTVITMAQPMEQVEPRLRTRMQDTRRVTFHVISAPGYWDVDRSHTKSRGNRHSSRSQGQGRAL